MTRRAILAGLLMFAAVTQADAATPIRFATCPQQVDGQTSDPPVEPVVVCQRLFPAAPFVRLPPDQRPADGQATLYGVVELDINVNFHIQNARFYDRKLTTYALVGAGGKPIDETSELMKKNRLPSNRVHFLIYEATGKITSPQSLQLTGLRPVILVEGRVLDERFLGAWEGLVSKRRAETQWYTDPREPQNFAKIRINFAPPLIATDLIGELKPTPPLVDGKRFKVRVRSRMAHRR